ncbi:hypothetical protein [Bacillus sp. FSL K6-3431]|uniref:hypothetical protein n=1 Tax=Bacillus sp. FSL K6-3431 TaxID=2921500 RepID=UPI0030F90F2C
MYSWRVTKYDPLYRDTDGSYFNQEEWTCFSEVGTNVSIDEDLMTEDKYLNAISAFMVEMGLNVLYINALEQWSDEVKSQHANKLWIGKAITAQEVLELAKMTLQNAIWCKLGVEKEFFVHFGNDYYMYIGASKDCVKAIDAVSQSGLFVEDFVSPYLAEFW